MRNMIFVTICFMVLHVQADFSEADHVVLNLPKGGTIKVYSEDGMDYRTCRSRLIECKVKEVAVLDRNTPVKLIVSGEGSDRGPEMSDVQVNNMGLTYRYYRISFVKNNVPMEGWIFEEGLKAISSVPASPASSVKMMNVEKVEVKDAPVSKTTEEPKSSSASQDSKVGKVCGAGVGARNLFDIYTLVPILKDIQE